MEVIFSGVTPFAKVMFAPYAGQLITACILGIAGQHVITAHTPL